jgi:hypothetical protein
VCGCHSITIPGYHNLWAAGSICVLWTLICFNPSRMMQALLIALLLCAACCVVLADLDASTFTSTVLEDDKVWLIKFYSSMCGGCTEFAPTWDKVS